MGIKLKEIDKIENIYLYSDGYSLEFSYDNKYLHFYNILYDLKTKEKFKIDDECCYNFTFKRNNKEAFFLLADESKKEYKVNLSLFSLNLDTKEKKLLIENAKKSSSYVNNFIYLGSLNQFWFLDEVGVITIYDEFSLKEIKKVFTIRDVMADKSKKVIEKSETPYETPSIWHVSSLTLSPNEKYIALNIANGICIYDIEEDKVINYVSRIDELEYTYKGETSFCRYEMKGELIYSSDSSKIFALDYFKYGIVYDAKTLEILQPLGNTSYFNLGGFCLY
jgi:WD40 repeat protein